MVPDRDQRRSSGSDRKEPLTQQAAGSGKKMHLTVRIHPTAYFVRGSFHRTWPDHFQ